MKKAMINFINSEISTMIEKILSSSPSTKKDEISKIYNETFSKLNLAFTEKAFYARDKFGKVSKFLNLNDLSSHINYPSKTIDCYLSKGDGVATFKDFLVSTIPIFDVEINPVEEGFWFRDLKGKVSKFDNLENAAKACKLRPKSLYTYLSSGKGKASTKMGVISTSPLRELTFTESFEQNYYLKHGYYPDPSEIPDEPRTNSQGRRY
jgi:hypothetical protein